MHAPLRLCFVHETTSTRNEIDRSDGGIILATISQAESEHTLFVLTVQETNQPTNQPTIPTVTCERLCSFETAAAAVSAAVSAVVVVAVAIVASLFYSCYFVIVCVHFWFRLFLFSVALFRSLFVVVAVARVCFRSVFQRHELSFCKDSLCKGLSGDRVRRGLELGTLLHFLRSRHFHFHF